MKKETQRRVENLVFGLQLTLEALDDLKQDKFYSKGIKFHGNRLLETIEKTFAEAFKDSSENGTNYYIRLNDWLKIASSTFSQFENLTEESKLKYLNALANFNTINLREK
jgi:hypothetical protein